MMSMQTIRNWQNPFTGPLKLYYLSLLGAYLLVPAGFSYMTASFLHDGFNPGKIGRETFFMQMMLVSILAAIAVIPLFGIWMNRQLRRAKIVRSKLDVLFAAAPIGVPVFCFVLGWLNHIH
jgi:hypothetical protein